MDLWTIILFMCVSGGIFLLYAWRNVTTLGYAAGILLVIVGTVVFVQGMQVPSGELHTKNVTEVIDGNNTSITGTVRIEQQRDTMDPMFSRGLGLALLFAGLHIFYHVKDRGIQ